MDVRSNIWKFFVYSLTSRRHYIPILSIYYMTLPGATAAQIGAFMAIGYMVGFLFEIPSGYFSDRFGHKNTLIISKICMLLSTIMFLFGYSFIYFVLGAVFMSLAAAFYSGTSTAFMHETLDELGKEKEFTKIMGKIRGDISLVSLVLIVSLPFFTAIDIRMPLAINLGFDIIGLLISFILVTPTTKKEIAPSKNIIELIKETKGQKFYPIAIFSSIIIGFLFAEHAYRTVYLTSIGYPIVYIGFVMGLSRFFWFIFGRYTEIIEKRFTIKQLLFAEIFIFTFYYISASLLNNPYIIGLIFSMIIGYQWGRTPIIQNYLINSLKDKKYKATMLSIKSQIASIIQIVLAVVIGFVMSYSYQLGYAVMGILIFIALGVNYIYILRSLDEVIE